MENKSSNGWKFFALLFGALLAGVVGLYVYKQQNPDYDPWEEPWENSSSPVDLGLTKDTEDGEAEVAPTTPEAAWFLFLSSPAPHAQGFLFCPGKRKGTIPKRNRPFVITPYLTLRVIHHAIIHVTYGPCEAKVMTSAVSQGVEGASVRRYVKPSTTQITLRHYLSGPVIQMRSR